MVRAGRRLLLAAGLRRASGNGAYILREPRLLSQCTERGCSHLDCFWVISGVYKVGTLILYRYLPVFSRRHRCQSESRRKCPGETTCSEQRAEKERSRTPARVHTTPEGKSRVGSTLVVDGHYRSAPLALPWSKACRNVRVVLRTSVLVPLWFIRFFGVLPPAQQK